MRKLSVERVYGCSTFHRHGLVVLPENRLALIAGAHLIIVEISTGQRQWISFVSIEFLFVSPSGNILAVIDRSISDDQTKIILLSSKSFERFLVIESNRFGHFRSLTMNFDETILIVLHDRPGYMLTIRND